jgi:predicted nucleic acid-binding protein
MIMLDTNVIMEILEKRARLENTLSVIGALQPQGDLAITTLTLSNIFYLYRKRSDAFPVLEKQLKAYKIINVTDQDAAWAFDHYEEQDYEDALQIGAALRENCSAFLTLDTALAEQYGKYLTVTLIR